MYLSLVPMERSRVAGVGDMGTTASPATFEEKHENCMYDAVAGRE